MRTHTTDDFSSVNADVYAEAMNKHGTFGSACEVQAAAGVYPGYKFEVYANRACVVSFWIRTSTKR